MIPNINYLLNTYQSGKWLYPSDNHNASFSLNSLTQGLRPFAPRSAQDLQINDVIKFSRQGGKLSQGTIKFIGHLPGRGDIYLGVELDKEGMSCDQENENDPCS